MTSTTSLAGYDAIKFINDILWKSDQTHISYNIFDSITVDNTGIVGWLFISSDGLVKSKSKGRWNPTEIAERSTVSTSSDLLGLYSFDGVFWKRLTREFLSTLKTEPRQTVIVPYGYLEPFIGASPVYIEQSFDCQSKGKKASTYFSTSVLTNAKTKTVKMSKMSSKAEKEANEIPLDRVPCLSKEICELCKAHSVELIRLIEGKLKVKVHTMSAVLVVESVERYPLAGPAPTRRVWLHHIRSITYASSASGGGGGGVGGRDEAGNKKISLERRSVASSTVTLGTKSYSRPAKCTGDFCQFNDLEELRTMNMLAANSGANINTRLEVIKAKQRHRRLTESEAAKTEELALADSDGLGTRRRNDLDAGSDEEEEEDVFGDVLTGGAGGGGGGGEDRPAGLMPSAASTGCKVPFKAVALARQEISQIEAALKDYQGSGSDEIAYLMEKVPWPERLLHWWLRIGRSHGARQALVPVTAADKISAAIVGAGVGSGTQTSPTTHESAANRGSGGGGGGMESGLKKGFSDDASYNPSESGTSSAIPFDLSENSFANRECKKAGIISWYYSEATVCDRCYSLYKDLDMRRKSHVSSQLKEHRNNLEKREVELGRALDHKIFNQRKAASRLSKPVTGIAGSGGGGGGEGGSVAASGSILTSEGFGGGSSKFSSADPTWAAMNDAFDSRSLLLAGRSNGPAVSKSVLPPMPWQLGDKESRETYEKSGSAFIRNIGKKSHEILSDLRQEKMLEKYQIKPSADDSSQLSVIQAGGFVSSQVIDQEWSRMTRIAEPARVVQPRRQPEPVGKIESFDPDRLLHPYQRGLQKMREEMTPDDERRPLPARLGPVKIVLTKPASTKSVVIRDNGSGGGGGGGKSAKKREENKMPLHLKLMHDRQLQQAAATMKTPLLSSSIDDNSIHYEGSYNHSNSSSSSSNVNNKSGIGLAPSMARSSSMGQYQYTLQPHNTDSSDSSSLAMASVGSANYYAGGMSPAKSPGKSLRKQVSFGTVDVNRFEVDREASAVSASTSASAPASASASQYSSQPSSYNSRIGGGGGGGGGGGSGGGGGGSSGAGYEDDDDDDEEIGWSPFVIPQE